MYGLVLQAAPTSEPLDLSEIKRQVDIAQEMTEPDAKLTDFAIAARQYVERYTGRQLMTATWDLVLDAFPSSYEPIYLPNPPIVSVTSIIYLDAAGDSQTWGASNYRLSTSREPGRVVPAFGQSYPTTRSTTDAATVRYVAGYASAALVPKAIRQAMLLLVGHWFANREAVGESSNKGIEFALQSLLDTYRVGDEFTCYSGRGVAYA